MSFLGVLSRFFDSEEYKKNPVPQNLTPEQFSAINIGAINAEQTGYFCDSLSTGEKMSEIKENLSNYYGIVDRASALETLEWLYTSGHRVYFDVIKGVVSGRETEINAVELDEEDIDRLKEYFSNLQESMDVLIEEAFISSKADLFDCSIAAWDMGRLVLVTRCCFDVGYISDDEAWSYINKARQTSKEHYRSWKEFAVQEYPCLQDASFSVINLLEDTLNAQHIWVVAYDKGGMRFIPAKSNPFTQTLAKYEDTTPFFDWKKQLAANLFVGNKTEENEYIPYSAITRTEIDESSKKVVIHIGNIKKSFKYQLKDCFGAPQEEALNAFFQYLKKI